MTVTPLALQGAYLLQLPAFADSRGLFVKVFQDSVWKASGIEFALKETYYSLSGENVIRGMHFQLPPHQHSKIVFCLKGAILDVMVDLRKGSDTYGQYFAHELSDKNHNAVFIPEGFAHGFKALADDTLSYYLVSSEYNREQDTGIRYDSFGFDWAVGNPVLSERDLSFQSLAAFDSPF